MVSFLFLNYLSIEIVLKSGTQAKSVNLLLQIKFLVHLLLIILNIL